MGLEQKLAPSIRESFVWALRALFSLQSSVWVNNQDFVLEKIGQFLDDGCL